MHPLFTPDSQYLKVWRTKKNLIRRIRGKKASRFTGLLVSNTAAASIFLSTKLPPATHRRPFRSFSAADSVRAGILRPVSSIRPISRVAMRISESPSYVQLPEVLLPLSASIDDSESRPGSPPYDLPTAHRQLRLPLR